MNYPCRTAPDCPPLPAPSVFLLGALFFSAMCPWCQPWDEKDAPAMAEEFSLEDLFGDDVPGKEL